MTSFREYVDQLRQGTLAQTDLGHGVLVEVNAADDDGFGGDPTKRSWNTDILKVPVIERDAEGNVILPTPAPEERVTDTSAVYPLVKSERNPSADICIGRGPRNDIVIDEQSVSTRHALIEDVGRGLQVVDQGSANGTYVGSDPLTPSVASPLSSGQVIRLGERELLYLDRGGFQKLLASRL